MKNSWTMPKVKSYPIESGKDWYVWFRFNGVLRKVKRNLNKISDPKERLLEATALAAVLQDRLNRGWNPIHKKIEITPTKQKLNLIEALDFALKKKQNSIAQKSYFCYRCAARFFQNTCKKLGIDKLSISECERYHVKLVMDSLQKKRKWTNKNYNKNLGYIKSLFTELVEWEYIKFNVVRDIRLKKEVKTEGYIQPTDAEHHQIFNHLKKVDYNFYVFCSVEYYLGIRPKEILSLHCKDIDLKRMVIRLNAHGAKDATYRYVPILQSILPLLQQMDLSNPDFYAFGRPETFNRQIAKTKFFSPNPCHIKRDTSTRRWKKLIIDGLGIKVKCYSLKHKGANDKLKAGMNLKTISEIFGHSDEKMTEIYANYMNQIRFKEAQKIKLEKY